MNRPAGEFGAWLAAMRAVLRGERDADVPCDGCVGCCVSSYPIPLRPTDTTALANVPDQYLSLPGVHGMARMLHREDGTCPMLESGKCTIYANRPQTCRDYDCRIYAAAGLVPDGDRPVIQERVGEWQFEFADVTARQRAIAVQRAAHFIRRNAAAFPPAMRAHSATAAAVLAVKCHELFAAPVDHPVVGERILEVLAAIRVFDGADDRVSCVAPPR